MSAMAERRIEPHRRRRTLTALAWWAAAAAGGVAGGLLPHPLAAAVVSAAAVGMLQALTFRSDLRYGAAWFGATAIAGALGIGAAVVGGFAFAEVAGGERSLVREGLAAWIGLAGLGGLLLAAAQAPLSGRRGLALDWCVLGLLAGGMLWPAGLALGYRFGPDLAARLTEVLPQVAGTRVPIVQTVSFAAAWLLHSLPFGIVVAATSGERR
jgi:hypothetical protein